MSHCRRQIILQKIDPQIPNLKYNRSTFLLNKGQNKMNPNLPSFKRTPANTIEPEMGASTWAFGSQTCTRYIGVLTINPSVINVQNQKLFKPTIKLIYLLKVIKIRSNGKEEITV